MHEPHLSAGVALAGAVAGAGVTAALEQASLAFFGIPLAAATAAMTGALVPALLLDPEPLGAAVRHWAGSVALAMVATGILMLLFSFDRPYAIGVAGLLGVFARDVHAAIRGEVSPLIAALRGMVTRRGGQ